MKPHCDIIQTRMESLEQSEPGTIRFDQLSYFETILAPRRLSLSVWLLLSAVALGVLTIISVHHGDTKIIETFGLYGALIGLVPLNTKIIYTILLD